MCRAAAYPPGERDRVGAHLGRGCVGMRNGRSWVINGALLLAAAVIVYFGVTSLFHQASAKGAVRTATAVTGTVQQTVTASGNVAPTVSQSVNFGTGGTVTSINVTVGEHVASGQLLATLDPGPAQAALTAAQDNLTAAEDNLSLAQSGGETPPQQQEDAAALAAAGTNVSDAQTSLSEARAQLASDQAACNSSTTTTVAGTGRPASGAAGTPASSPCSQVGSDEQSVTSAQNGVAQAEQALQQEQLAIAAKRYVNPGVLASDEAALTLARQAVTTDQKTLLGTSLLAPFDATVTSISGSLGQTVSGGGSSGSIGSSGSGSGAGGSGTASSASSGNSTSSSGASSASSASGFITLADLSSLQVTAGFPEADAVKIRTGQPAVVSLSALASTSVGGTVTAISPVPTVVSNVVTYDVTVSLAHPPPTVHDGMSTTVAVVVASAAGTLELPSSAVTTTGSVSTVQLLRNGRQTTQVVTVGLVGDSTTQILSGLSPGDQVVEPTVTVSGAGTTGTGTGGGPLFGGGLGGGIGGGGGGARRVGGG